MLKFTVRPFDVLFFGSGKPFNIGGTARSIFPPFPHTFAAAICSKIYHEFKIDVSNILKEVYGPFLIHKGELYFPKPADICKDKGGKKLFVLELIDDSELSLFKVGNTNKPSGISKLPVHRGTVMVESFDGFISKDGLQRWINGYDVEEKHIKETEEKHIKETSDIFEYEGRVGIKQDIETHTVVPEDGLYRVDFIRMKQDWGFVFYVEFNFDELEKKGGNSELKDEEGILKFFERNRVLKFGGEMKTVHYEVEKVKDNCVSDIFKKPDVKGGEIIKILFLTHATFDKDPFYSSGSGLKVVSAVVDGYLNFAMSSERLNLKNFTKRGIKAGSVFYAEVPNSGLLDDPWFKPFERCKVKQNFELIGSNLVIYGKVKKGGQGYV